MAKLTLELPDALYERFRANAERHGTTVEKEIGNVLLANQPPSAETGESQEDVLERMRKRRESMPEVTVSPEELKEWINFGRP